jgi:Lysyl oxidase
VREPSIHPAKAAARAMLVSSLLVLAACGNDSGDAGADGDATPSGDATTADPPAGAATTESTTPEPATSSPSDDRLLPDLRSLPPEDVQIEVLADGRRLRFTSIIANSGIGPIETMPDALRSCPDEQRHASQVIYHDIDGDGQFDRDTDTRTTTRPAGCMLDHPGHEHWHFDAAASYKLTHPGDTQPIVEADKVSFCWRDNREVPAAIDERPDEHYGDCDYDEVQGISPGWADVYPERLDDQHLDLPDDLADGVYCLWNEADPLDLLVESDDGNNAAVLAIEITGNDVAEADDNSCG